MIAVCGAGVTGEDTVLEILRRLGVPIGKVEGEITDGRYGGSAVSMEPHLLGEINPALIKGIIVCRRNYADAIIDFCEARELTGAKAEDIFWQCYTDIGIYLSITMLPSISVMLSTVLSQPQYAVSRIALFVGVKNVSLKAAIQFLERKAENEK